jgi:ATP-binding cassette subfamily B multidrug efflux pump
VLIVLMRRHLRPYARQVMFVSVLLFIQAIANLYLPNLNADIINNGVVKGNIHYIWTTGALMLGLTLMLGVVAILAVYWASMTAMGVGRDVRGAVFEHVQRLSERELNAFGTPSLINRNTNDIQQIQIFLQMALIFMIPAPIICVGGVIMALQEDVALSSLLLVVVPLMLILIGILLVKALPLFETMQGRLDRINLVMREQLTGVRVIRAFVRSEYEEERFERANADLTATALSVNRMFALVFPTLMGILNLSSVAAVWFGGHLIASGNMPIGNLTAFLNYILQILMAVMMAVMMVILVPRAAASAARIEEVLRVQPSIGDPEVPQTAQEGEAGIEFREVTFGYPGGQRPVLHEVSFSMRPGETTAIIGGTGSGKSTVLNLVTRFFDVTSGGVTVGGVDVRNQSLDGLWSLIGVVPQNAYLFSGTVADNLRFGQPDASDADLWHALDVAQAHDFVAAMPGGLAATIEQGGANVSGGQRQRLSIARALVKRPHVYLFDDCFSALDSGTDARLRAALREETQDATVVIVAQRVSTILSADRIIVLESGRIVGTGTHESLLSSCAPYQEIVESQLGEAAAS